MTPAEQRRPLRRTPRSADMGRLQDTFLIAAVTMIIVIRLQLWATDYPALGGGRLHIAHLLWGGVFMVLTIGMLLSFVGRSLRVPAAILGGIGFGFFIDELGKFITKDNDYFFKPTAAIIYVVFLLLYALTRWMQRRARLTPDERVANAIDLLVGAGGRLMTHGDQRRARDLLTGLDDVPLVPPLRRLIDEVPAVAESEPSRVQRLATRIRERYFVLIERPWFQWLLVWGFGIWAALIMFQVAVLALAGGLRLGDVQAGFEVDGLGHLSLVNIASWASSVVAALLAVVGIRAIRRGDRVGGYRWLARSLMVEIFVTQVFVFAESSFSGITVMLWSILLLVTVRVMIGAEEHGALKRRAVP